MVRQLTVLGRLFVRCARDERGSEIVEYAFVIGAVGVGAYVMMKNVGDDVVQLWRRIDDAMSAIR